MKTIFKIFICLLLVVSIFSLSSCQRSIDNVLSQNEGDEKAQSKGKEEIKQLEKKAEDKSFSPDRRIKIYIENLDKDSADSDSQNANYRLTAIDNEQQKVVFSKEFHYGKADELKIVKVFDNFVVVEHTISNTPSQLFAISTEDGESKELTCKGFKQIYELTDLTDSKYTCKGVKEGTEKEVSEEISLPVFLTSTSRKNSDGAKQTKESGNLKVELSPFDESKGYTFMGQRAFLKLFKDGKQTYEKFFSGKCTGCRWVNQEHWQEAFKIEQLSEDKILLTQMLIELDDNDKPKDAEPLRSSILLIPSHNKIIHLDCGEKNGELAYVTKFDVKNFTCKYISSSKAEFEKPLPL